MGRLGSGVLVSASSEISALTAGWNTLGEEENCPGGEKMSEGKCPVLVSAASDHSVFADEHGGLWDREPTPGPGAARRGGGSWGRQPQVTLSPQKLDCPSTPKGECSLARI